MASFHPVFVSDKLVETVNFYEDYFGFIPEYEADGYVLMKKMDDPTTKIAFFDTSHNCVSDKISPIRGLILDYEVDNPEAAYDRFYLEGLDFFKDIGTDIFGRSHFVVCDPNGVLINVCARDPQKH